jgi:aminomethyltransferase
MPIGTPLHSRTSQLCESLNWRDWSGYFAVSAYEATHEHEYNAIRQASALIDISPLFKYLVTGTDAARLIDRVITRDAHKIAVGQVVYTHWCDGDGKVIDDGTVARLEDGLYRWTAAEPTLRWIRQNATGLDVSVEDVSDRIAALALQGPTSKALLASCAEGDIAGLKYFRVMKSRIGGIDVQVSRTGYTGDLGYEIWSAAGDGPRVWDALMDAGRAFDITPTGILALDVARIEAGMIMLDVDYTGAKKAMIPSQRYTPYEIGLGRLVKLDKGPFIGQRALQREAKRGPARSLVGIEVDWHDVESLHDKAGLPPQIAATASRASIPLYQDSVQVGRVTSSAWSPLLKKLIGLASVRTDMAKPGQRLDMELTVDHKRLLAGATVANLPFFDPPRKKA